MRAARLPLETARYRLAFLWFPMCGIFFLLMVLQTLLGAFGDRANEAWGWALPNFLPTLALMVSVFAATALQDSVRSVTVVHSSFFKLSFGLSAFYIIILFLILIVPAFRGVFDDIPPTPSERLRNMELSNLFLGPLQSLVVAALGALFFLKEDERES